LLVFRQLEYSAPQLNRHKARQHGISRDQELLSPGLIRGKQADFEENTAVENYISTTMTLSPVKKNQTPSCNSSNVLIQCHVV